MMLVLACLSIAVVKDIASLRGNVFLSRLAMFSR